MTLPSGPHRRYDPLGDEWVLVSAERTRRPWLGSREPPSPDAVPSYDPTCYLCPGNARVGGERNPDYTSTFVFANDFAALQPDSPLDRFEDDLLVAEGERGTCLVQCFSPRHDLSLGQISREGVRLVIDQWGDLTANLAADYAWVQVFENRGAQMGASNRHPHGQIWAGSSVPNRAQREDVTQAKHFRSRGGSLLLDYAAQELHGAREVDSDDEWLIVVPFWAAWPYETLIIPRRPVTSLVTLDDAQRESLAVKLGSLVRRYDDLFGVPFPYSMGWHQQPFDATDRRHWQLHAHVYPPLLRADVRKFMVGYELLSEAQRDLTAEDAAARLRG